MFKNLLFIVIFTLFKISPIYAPEWIQDEDESGKIKIIGEMLEQKLYSISIIDSFGGNMRWKIYRSISHLNRTQFIPITPNKIPFQEESSLFKKFNYSDDDQKSMIVQSYLENPGKQHIELRPEKPIKIDDGLPVKIIIWVYSNHYEIRLKAIFTQKYSKEIQIDFGDLNFDGWKRIEKDILLPQKNLKLLDSLKKPFYLKSILLISGPFQKKGEFFVYMDRMYILINQPKSSYPGSEIKDNWNKLY